MPDPESKRDGQLSILDSGVSYSIIASVDLPIPVISVAA